MDVAGSLPSRFPPAIPASSEDHITRIVECIGTCEFEPVLEQILRRIYGAVRFASYRSFDARLTRIAGTLDETEALHAISGFDSRAVGHAGIAEQTLVGQRATATVARRYANSVIWVVIQCEPGALRKPCARQFLSSNSELLAAAHAKHAEMMDAYEDAPRALASLSHIEQCLAATGALPRREVEVCARIIYGLSTLGIAVDLCVGEETVRTYRKRAYQRLALGTEHQLLTWYLKQWTQWRAGLWRHPDS
jgi:DNA-binding CsgD family transcriptional regulator